MAQIDGASTGEAFASETSAPFASAGNHVDTFVRQRAGRSELSLAVFGAKCAGCISKIEGAVKALSGIEEARLNLSTGKLLVAWHGTLGGAEIVSTITALGYRAAPYDPAANEKETDEQGKLLLKCLAVAGFAAANIMLLSVSIWAGGSGEMGVGTRTMLHFVSGLIAFPAVLFSGRPFFSSALQALRAGHANMDVPISLAVLLAFSFSVFETIQQGEDAYFDAAVMLLFFLLIGRWLDHALRYRASAAARDLVALQAVTANRLLPDGSVEAVSGKAIKPDDHLLLSPGDRVPVTGVILDGKSEIDVSLVTGESVPLLMELGARLEAGMVNLSRPLTIRALASVEDSLVAELVRLVEAGQQSKSHFVRLADKAARLYVPVVHTLAAVTFLGWFFLLEAGLRVSMMNAISVLIITCPCALGLATPAVQIVATGRLFRQGILVKTGDALERLSQVTRFVFDKTGTLTMGRLRLTNASDVPPDAMAAAAALARSSRHPVANAIVAEAGQGPVCSQVEEYPGDGLSGIWQGNRVRLGRAGFLGLAGLPDQATTGSWLQVGEAPPVQFLFEDTLRPSADTVVQHLRQNGYSVTMLSGDQPAPVAQVAGVLGIDDWQAALTPKDKLAIVSAFEAAGEKVAMIGDGLNDAPVLAMAHVSLSPGSATQAAQSAADFVFQGDSIQSVLNAQSVAQRAQRHIIQNFSFAALYNLVAAPLAMAGFVTPLIAALAMSGSSLIVTLNAMRLSLGKNAQGAPPKIARKTGGWA